MNVLEKKRKRRWGDLKYGRLLRSLDPLYKFTPFIMREKVDATNYFLDCIEISPLEEYIRQKRKAGYKGFGLLHVIIAAYLRVVSQRPAANRFIQGQRIYARNNVEVVMAVKQKMSVDAAESMIKIKFQPNETVFDVYDRINEYVESVKNGAEDNGTDKTAGFLIKLPRFLLRFALAVIRAFDYYGKLPLSLLDVSPFHGSIVITDLGSLGIKPCFHHIYNFGNVPAFMAFGAKRKENVVEKDGTVTEKKYVDYTFSLDERICDGMYFAVLIKEFRNYLRHPEMLETAPEKVVEDVD